MPTRGGSRKAGHCSVIGSRALADGLCPHLLGAVPPAALRIKPGPFCHRHQTTRRLPAARRQVLKVRFLSGPKSSETRSRVNGSNGAHWGDDLESARVLELLEKSWSPCAWYHVQVDVQVDKFRTNRIAGHVSGHSGGKVLAGSRELVTGRTGALKFRTLTPKPIAIRRGLAEPRRVRS